MMTRGPLTPPSPRCAGRGRTARVVRAAWLVVAVAVAAACSAPARAPDAAADALAPARVARLRAYIRDAWPQLTRTLADLPAAARDDKVAHAAGAPWPVYFPATEDRAAIEAAVARAVPPAGLRDIVLRPLPAAVTEHGLLYLPRPYVVPGGRFNEMYGWDSYFIVLGLLRDADRARRDMIANFLYEVTPLRRRAQRQPHLLPDAVAAAAAVGDGAGALPRRRGDRAWLRDARDALVASYQHWTAPPHLVAGDSASRATSTTAKARRPRSSPASATPTGTATTIACARISAPTPASLGLYDRHELTPHSTRPTGDARIGLRSDGPLRPVRRRHPRIAPVCLNTLLYRDGAGPGRRSTAPSATAPTPRAGTSWRAQRQARIEALLWDDGAGLYFDYDFDARAPPPLPVRDHVLAAVGGAGLARAGAPRARHLAVFERRGGIVTSTTVTGAQWDAPFGWAPLQLFAVDGPAPLRLPRRRRPHRARVPVDAGRGLRAPRHAGREIRRRARAPPTSAAGWRSATPATRSASAGPTASPSSCSTGLGLSASRSSRRSRCRSTGRRGRRRRRR